MREPEPVPPLLTALARMIAPSGLKRRSPIAALNDADWAAVLQLAQRHRVLPALAEAAKASRLPGPVGERLSRAANGAVFEEMQMSAGMHKAVTLLAAAGIVPTILKGVPLSLHLHGRLGLRTSRDVDLLVNPQDAYAALSLLRQAGYRVAQADRVDSAARLQAYSKRYKDIELFDDEARVVVELHWRLFDNPNLLDVTNDTDRAIVPYPGHSPYQVLPEPVTIRYLACHGAQHGWSRLKWLLDFAQFIDRDSAGNIDTFYLSLKRAEERRCLAQALLLCGILFDREVPRPVQLDASRDWRIRTLVRLALASMVVGGEREIEAVRFGSTRKNLSHYLISASPRFLWDEVLFDLYDDPEREVCGALMPRLSARLWRWLNRHYGKVD